MLCKSANPLGKIMDYVQVCEKWVHIANEPSASMLSDWIFVCITYTLPPPPSPSQEDMDSMEKELNTWKAENEKHGQSLKKEERYS